MPQLTNPITNHFSPTLQTNGLPPSPVHYNKILKDILLTSTAYGLKITASGNEKWIRKDREEKFLLALPLPASPPAHTKLVESSTKFNPNLVVVLNWFWHEFWSTNGTSTSFMTAWYDPLLKSFRPHPWALSEKCCFLSKLKSFKKFTCNPARRVVDLSWRQANRADCWSLSKRNVRR